MEWLSRLLVCVLVVTGISVALASSCHGSDMEMSDGGSCSQTQLEPSAPQTCADVSLVRVGCATTLAAPLVFIVPTFEAAFPSDEHNRAAGAQKPIAFAMRD